MDAETRALAAALLAKLGADEATLSVRDVLGRYAASPEFADLVDRTTETGRIAHLLRLLGDAQVAGLTLATLDDYRLARAKEPGRRKVHGERVPTAPSTRNREVDRLARALNWAVERKLIALNPIAVHPDETEPPPRRTSITSADVDLLRSAALEHGRDPRIGLTLRAMISTKYDAFLRRGELCALRWSNLRFRDGTIEIQGFKHHRDAVRETILSDRAAEDLREMPRALAAPFVFLNTRGQRYHPRTFLAMLQKVAARAGVHAAEGENLVAHDLRAGGASEQLELGTPERDLMDMAGWTTREMIDRYHRRRGARAVARAKARLEASRL